MRSSHFVMVVGSLLENLRLVPVVFEKNGATRLPCSWVVAEAIVALGLLVGSGKVAAQQPLSEFLEAAHRNALSLEDARAGLRVAESASNQARAVLLPNFQATGTYTRNEYEVAFQLMPTSPRVVITAYDQLAARFAINAPIIDVSSWLAFFQSESNADSAEIGVDVVQQEVDLAVVQLWYQLVGSRALLDAAERNLSAVERNMTAARARVEVGVSPQLELSRSETEVARARQTIESARLAVRLTERNLENLTGLEPAQGETELELRDGAEPESLEHYTERVSLLPSIRLARQSVRSAELGVDSAWAGLLPRIFATGTESVTNAAGFSPDNVWALTFTASWQLDFATPARIETQSASLGRARVALAQSVQDAETRIYQAWHRLSAVRAQADAARSALDSSRRASVDASARYESGAGTQLEQIQAERDLFAAEVALIQAIADVEVASASLRISSGLAID